MPLQNRVDPFGDIHAVDARGLFTGNRGIIHDPATKTLLKRRWSSKAWIICTCDYKSRRREVMGRNANGKAGWTELFFLDEVTALAAGHRPCFTCRREEAKAFAACYGRAFKIDKPRAPEIDARLHGERLASSRGRGAARSAEMTLPDGTMIHDGKIAYALRAGQALRWSFHGYDDPIALSSFEVERLQVLTPATTIATLATGYVPVWHPTAGRT